MFNQSTINRWKPGKIGSGVPREGWRGSAHPHLLSFQVRRYIIGDIAKGHSSFFIVH